MFPGACMHENAEANIQQDMEKCKAALREGRWEELRTLVLAIAAKARRAQEVGETAVSKASDRSYRATLSSAVTRLERGKPWGGASYNIILLSYTLSPPPPPPQPFLK